SGTASDIKIVDDHTIKITQAARNPSSTFVRNIMETAIVPAHVFGRLLPADFWTRLKTARGTGKAADAARAQITALAPKALASAPVKDVSAGPYVLKRINPGEALLVKNPY